MLTPQLRTPCVRPAGLDIDALRDVSKAVNGLKSQQQDMGILMVTHYKVGRLGRGGPAAGTHNAVSGYIF